MIIFIKQFDIKEFMTRHNLVIVVDSYGAGYDCFLMHGDQLITTKQGVEICAFSDSRSDNSILSTIRKEIYKETLFIDGKNVFVI